MASSKPSATQKPRSFVLGRARFGKISEVEGIRKSPESLRMFEEFDRKGTPPAQRRKVILQKYAKKS